MLRARAQHYQEMSDDEGAKESPEDIVNRLLPELFKGPLPAEFSQRVPEPSWECIRSDVGAEAMIRELTKQAVDVHKHDLEEQYADSYMRSLSTLARDIVTRFRENNGQFPLSTMSDVLKLVDAEVDLTTVSINDPLRVACECLTLNAFSRLQKGKRTAHCPGYIGSVSDLMKEFGDFDVERTQWWRKKRARNSHEPKYQQKLWTELLDDLLKLLKFYNAAVWLHALAEKHKTQHSCDLVSQTTEGPKYVSGSGRKVTAECREIIVMRVKGVKREGGKAEKEAPAHKPRQRDRDAHSMPPPGGKPPRGRPTKISEQPPSESVMICAAIYGSTRPDGMRRDPFEEIDESPSGFDDELETRRNPKRAKKVKELDTSRIPARGTAPSLISGDEEAALLLEGVRNRVPGPLKQPNMLRDPSPRTGSGGISPGLAAGIAVFSSGTLGISPRPSLALQHPGALIGAEAGAGAGDGAGASVGDQPPQMARADSVGSVDLGLNFDNSPRGMAVQMPPPSGSDDNSPKFGISPHTPHPGV